jgi:iron(II)-dependent oxidoreductase
MTAARVPDASSPLSTSIAAGLADVRERTLRIVAPVSDVALEKQHSPLMSPILWDLGHIAEFENLWLAVRLGEVVEESALPDVFDAMRTPRSRRGELSLPDRDSMLTRLAEVRANTLELLEAVDFEASANRLIENGFVYELVREHEAQHQETILQTLILMECETYAPTERRRFPAVSGANPGEMVAVPAGRFERGAAPGAFAYDNELPSHVTETRAFEIGRYPVTNGEYIEFVAAGGYRDPRLWSDAGWSWKEKAGLAAPQYWRPEGVSRSFTAAQAEDVARSRGVAGWERATSLGVEPLRGGDPVVHVCYHEAEACARFAGGRLPTETEWEKAAAWDPDTGGSLRYPWGGTRAGPDLANLDAGACGVAPIGSFPAGCSPVGCEQLLGDTWEWTSSAFGPYPGFEAYPYDDYSKVFFGKDYMVLRGASWATDAGVARSSFRNWDYPIRRQIFAGFRLARDSAR